MAVAGPDVVQSHFQNGSHHPSSSLLFLFKVRTLDFYRPERLKAPEENKLILGYR